MYRVISCALAIVFGILTLKGIFDPDVRVLAPVISALLSAYFGWAAWDENKKHKAKEAEHARLKSEQDAHV